MNRNMRMVGIALGALVLWSGEEGAKAYYTGEARTFPIEQVLEPGIQSASEKWSGLFAQSSPGAPRNTGTLVDGLNPDSGSATTLFRKISGGGYLATNSIYWQSGGGGVHGPGGGPAPWEDVVSILMGTVTPAQAQRFLDEGYGLDGKGVFQISSTLDQPVELNSIVFQIRIGGFGPTEEQFADETYVSSYYLTHLLSPVTLTINGTTQVNLLDYWNLYYEFLDIGGNAQGTYPVDEIWAFQWDLSSYGPIESYTVEFANYPHSSIRGLQVDLVSAVPEPSAVALLIVASGAIGFSRLRRGKRFVRVSHKSNGRRDCNLQNSRSNPKEAVDFSFQ